MWLLNSCISSTASTGCQSKYARELCRPREPGNQRTLHHSFPRALTPSPRHRTARSGRGGRHPRAPLVWSFALQGEGRRPVSGSRLAPTPAAALAPRRAEREKNSRYYRTTGRLAVRAANPLSRLPTAHLTPRSLWAARPRKRTPTRGSSPPSPPSGAFRAFRYYSARPS